MSNTETHLSPRASDTIRNMLGIGGLVAVIIGLLILFNPVKSGAAMMQVLAIVMAGYALIVGVIYLGSAMFTRTLGGWARTGHILLGLLFIVGGVVLLSNLAVTATITVIFLSVTVGVLWILEGIMALSSAKHGGSRVWSIIFGVVSLLAGLVLIFSPFMGAFTLWVLLGVSLLLMGLSQIIRAFSVKGASA